MKLYHNINSINNICCFKFIRRRAVNAVYKSFLIKKVLNIIYKFSKNNYKILFLGVDKQYIGFLTFLKLKTSHTFIPTCLWLNGILSNKLIIKHSFLKKQYKCLIDLKLKHNFSLILMFNKFKYKNEIVRSNILSMTFLKNSINYSFSYNISNSIQNSIFFVLVYLIFKKINL